ncbi:unnamed protein product [Musa textilis]
MGWKLELGPGTLDFPVDFDDLRWQKKSITKGKGSKTYLEDPIPCRASNGHVLNYHRTGFDEECERFFSQIYKC